MLNNKIYDVAVIGAGPSGLTAAIYAKRAGLNVLVLEAESVGGQMALAPKIENFPSIISTSGVDLANKMFDQILSLEIDFELERLITLTKNETFTLECEYSTFYAKSVIYATGASHKKIGLPNEEELLGKGLSYCAVCDGAFYKGEEVAIIGDGNSALQYAVELSSYCPKVYVCTLFDKFFGDDVLVQKIKNTSNIEIIHHLSLKELVGEEKLEKLVFENLQTKEDFELKINGVFIAIGQMPHNEIIKDLVEINKAGYAVVNENLESEKTSGLFVAGDARDKKIRQVTTAMSDGAIAALSALKYLNNHAN